MKAAEFDYLKAKSLDEVCAALARGDREARIIAGGQTLAPLMAMRLARPELLVDINGIGEIKGIARENGEIRIGAATTQAEAVASDVLTSACPIIAEAIAVIADPQVRNCGTIGGNVANGDPGNDLPAVMMALGATFTLTGPSGSRQVAAREFYRGLFDTALEPGEILTEIRIAPPSSGHGYAYRKLKRKVGDYATAAAAVILEVEGGNCTRAAVTLTNVASAAIDATGAADALTGTGIDGAAIDEAARRAMDVTDPASDMHGPPEYRTRMAGEMTRRAIQTALARATGG